ncbi:Hypothetical protein A7982_08365 [Minicystis rosea]|nr:Hypothetical protein A7982_08365 [Minicystis rosea]
MRLQSYAASGLFLAFAALHAIACGGGSSGSDDPRCAALCTIKEPAIANAGDICSQASADACLDLCAAQVKDTSAPCGACLLDDADFGTSTSGNSGECSSSASCPDGECTESGPGGTCTYCSSDQAAQQKCYVQTHPRREVACETKFRDAAECAALCTVK